MNFVVLTRKASCVVVLGAALWMAGSLLQTKGESHQRNGSEFVVAVAHAQGTAQTPAPGSRAFGWMQLASFLRTSGVPTPDVLFDAAWSGTWFSKGQLGLASGPSSCQIAAQAPNGQGLLGGSGTIETPFQLKLQIDRNRATGLSSVFSVIPGLCRPLESVVYYNGVARDYIRSNMLSTENGMAGVNGGVKFPDGAIIVKEIWEQVSPESTIRAWSPSASQFLPSATGVNNSFPSLSVWPPEKVDPKSMVTIPLQPGQQKPTWVLVGFNEARKIGDEWYWFAFAWTPAGNQDCPTGLVLCNSDFPADLAGSWKHYLMNTTDTVQANSGDLTGQGICYNPYLEALTSNGLVSNCIRCHQFASLRTDLTHSVSNGIDPQDGGSKTPLSKTYVRRYFAPSEKLRQTNFLWSLVTHLDPS